MSAEEKKLFPNLYLVGFMGVGKSVIGRRLARALGFRFLDSDREIERVQGMKIPKIFEEQGEAVFRCYERDFIESGHPAGNCVVSCGGGLAVQPGMMDELKKRGVVICLFASAESIIERTSRNSNRPLLNVDDPEKRVRELLAQREPIYMQSSACITTEGRPIPEVVRHILRSYESRVPEAAGQVAQAIRRGRAAPLRSRGA